jgi:hypothetical protein
MEMRKLLEAMNKFAGEPEQKAGDQVRSTEKAKQGGKEHPFKGRLVGGESAEPNSNMLGELSQLSQDMAIENKLKEMWANFNEDDIGVEPRRPHRKGTRADKLGRRGHKEQSRYTTVKEVDVITPIKPIKPGDSPANPAADPNAIKQAIAATAAMKSATGSPAPAPNLAKALDAASQGKPISSTDAKVMEPIMDIVSKAAQDPKLANQFKTLAQQAKNTP